MRWALRASIVLSGTSYAASLRQGRCGVKDEERKSGSLPAPPPPYEQVAARGEDEQDAAGAWGDDLLLDRGQVSPPPRIARKRTPSDDEGRTAERRPLHRAALIAAVACVAAFAVAVGALAVGLSEGLKPADDRAIDSRPAAAPSNASSSAESSEVEEALSAQLAAVAADEDGALSAYVERFMADYDAGIDPASSYRFSDLGISTEELVAELRIGLGFRVEAVDVYGSKAWVEVTTTSKSFSEQADAFAAKVAGAASNYEDAESYREYLKEALLSSFDGVMARPSSALVVVDRGEDGWSFSSDDVASLLGGAWYGR